MGKNGPSDWESFRFPRFRRGEKKNKVFQADFIRVDLIVVADFVGVVLDDWLVHPGLE